MPTELFTQNIEETKKSPEGAVLGAPKISIIMDTLNYEPSGEHTEVSENDIYEKIHEIFGSGDYGENDLARQVISNLKELKPKLARIAVFKFYNLLIKLQNLQEAKLLLDDETLTNIQLGALNNFHEYIYEHIYYRANVEIETSDFDLLGRNINATDENILILSALLRLSRKQKTEIDLGKVDGVETDRIKGRDFSETDLLEMKSIYEINYGYTPQFANRLYEGFLKDRKNSNFDFIVLRYRGKILGCLGFEKTGDNKVNFGKFNINPQLRGSSIGGALLRNELEPVAKENIISATCTADDAIARNYINRGFVAYSIDEVDEINSLAIVRNEQKQSLFQSKSLSEDEIATTRAEYSKLVPLANHRGVFIYRFDSYQIDTVPWKELVGAQKDGKILVMTKYFYRDTNTDMDDRDFYLVFETVAKENLDSYLNDFDKK